MRALLAHPFPGNVRELENVLEHACIIARGDAVTLDDLPDLARPGVEAAPGIESSKRPRLRVSEGQLRALLESHDWNLPQVAAELGVHRSTAWRMMKRHGLSAPD